MNNTRMIVIGLVGLVIGVLIGFGFRGSLAEKLNLDAYMIPTLPPTAAADADSDLSGITGIGWKETDLYSRATSVKVPATIMLDSINLRTLLNTQGFPGIKYPLKLTFDLGTMTGAENTAVNACMAKEDATYSKCLVDNVIAPRATKK